MYTEFKDILTALFVVRLESSKLQPSAIPSITGTFVLCGMHYLVSAVMF